MLLSELISELQKHIRDHGDMQVFLDSKGWHLSEVEYNIEQGRSIILRSEMEAGQPAVVSV